MNQQKHGVFKLPRGIRFERDFFGVHSRELGETENWPVISEINYRTIRKYCHDRFQHETYYWHPALPYTNMAAYLHARIQERLPDKIKSGLRFHCLLGTCLDEHFGIDMIITLRGVNKFVPVHLTINPNKIPKSSKILILQRSFLIGAWRETPDENPFLQRSFITGAWREAPDQKPLMNFIGKVVEILQPPTKIIYLRGESKSL